MLSGALRERQVKDSQKVDDKIADGKVRDGCQVGSVFILIKAKYKTGTTRSEQTNFVYQAEVRLRPQFAAESQATIAP